MIYYKKHVLERQSTVHWADLTYISLLIIFCIIEYVTNKSLNPWICEILGQKIVEYFKTTFLNVRLQRIC